MNLFDKRQPDAVVCVCLAHVPFEEMLNRQVNFMGSSIGHGLEMEVRAECPKCRTELRARESVRFTGAAGYFAKVMIAGFCSALTAQAEFVRGHVEPEQHPAKP